MLASAGMEAGAEGEDEMNFSPAALIGARGDHTDTMFIAVLKPLDVGAVAGASTDKRSMLSHGATEHFAFVDPKFRIMHCTVGAARWFKSLQNAEQMKLGRISLSDLIPDFHTGPEVMEALTSVAGYVLYVVWSYYCTTSGVCVCVCVCVCV
jgi:hypothetical protein